MTVRPRRSPSGAPLLLVLALSAACGETGEDSPAPTTPGVAAAGTGAPAVDAIVEPAEVERAIRDLVTAVTPLPAEAPVGTRSNWFPVRRETLKRLRAGGPTLGRAALAEYHERVDDIDDVRAGLLDVAAHAATGETVELLVDLVTTYGPSLKLRRTATELLGQVAPERADAVLAPILREPKRGKTYPPDDIMMQAWLEAAAALELDRVALLTEVALDYRQSQEVRHVAAEALGELRPHEDVAAAKDALRTLLVESSGNNYLRRKAAQSLRSALTPEELCPILQDVLSKEADPNFGLFVNDMIENNCR